MTDNPPISPSGASVPPRYLNPDSLRGLRSEIVDRLRRCGNVWKLPQGEILLPRVFGFCRGVERALTCLEQEVEAHDRKSGGIFLLGEIIHNPWVNAHFEQRGVQILSGDELERLEKFVGKEDLAIIPAFGVPLPVEKRLHRIGCRIVDTSCGDVRKVWKWAQGAVAKGYGILIFGRPTHDEIVVTKSRLDAIDGRYLVVSDLEQVTVFCDLIAGAHPAETFRKQFGDDTTNSDTFAPFERIAQVSQTTMLYDETIRMRQLIRDHYAKCYGQREADSRLLFEPTVCRATQDRQSAAIELCRTPCDLVIVVGGFGSSNTRNLYELARGYADAFFVEQPDAIHSLRRLRSFDPDSGKHIVVNDWLPTRRPLRIGVLAGASTPEIVVGEVLRKLSEFLS